MHVLQVYNDTVNTVVFDCLHDIIAYAFLIFTAVLH